MNSIGIPAGSDPMDRPLPQSRIDQLLGVPQDPLGERRQKYIDGLRFRAIVAILFLCAFWALQTLNLTDSDPLNRAYPQLLILAGINWIYWRVGVHTQFALTLFYLHWAVDQVLISWILIRLGGIEVPYAFLAYVMIIVTSATFISKRASFIVAGGASICAIYIGILDVFSPSPATPVWGSQMDEATVTASVVFVVLFYFLFAYLSGTLADQLKEANHEVSEARNVVAAHNRRLEERVRRRTLELERRNTEVEEFVHVVTHDLRNVAVGVAELARRLLSREQESMSARGVRDAQRLLEDTRRMNEMLSSLLGIFRAEREGQEPQLVDLKDVVDTILRSQADRLERKRISVSVTSLPVVSIDAARVTHVLSNLVDNAIKYVGDKDSRQIIIRSTETEAAWTVEVRDNGVGIDAEQHEKIFQLYHRGPVQFVGGEEKPGEGVGLAMCKRIVERWGGEVFVESMPGAGSAFHVSIPKSSSRQLGSDTP